MRLFLISIFSIFFISCSNSKTDNTQTNTTQDTNTQAFIETDQPWDVLYNGACTLAKSQTDSHSGKDQAYH